MSNTLEIYNALPEGGANDLITLAQGERGGNNLDFQQVGYQPFTIAFDPQTKGYMRTAGMIVAVIWVVYALAKNVAPGQGGGGGGFFQKIGGFWPFLTAMVAIAFLMYPDMINWLINIPLRIGWLIMNWFGSGTSQEVR